MDYLIAILLPPLGLLWSGKLFQALLSIVLMLTVIGWPVAAAWAVLVVHNAHADRRAARLMRELRRLPV